MVESIVAAAVARSELSVLHMDWNDCYSADWASYNWKSLQEWLDSITKESMVNHQCDTETGSGEYILYSVDFRASAVGNIKQEFLIRFRISIKIINNASSN